MSSGEILKKMFLYVIFNVIDNIFSQEASIKLMSDLDKHGLELKEIDNILTIISLLKKQKIYMLSEYLKLLYINQLARDKIICTYNLFKRNYFIDDQADLNNFIYYVENNIEPYINSFFDKRFINSLYIPIDDEKYAQQGSGSRFARAWEIENKNELIERLRLLTIKCGLGICKICEIKKIHKDDIYEFDLNTLLLYYTNCGNKLKKFISRTKKQLYLYLETLLKMSMICRINKKYICLDRNITNNLITLDNFNKI